MTPSPRQGSPWALLRWAALAVLMVGGIALFAVLVYWSGPGRVFAEIVGMGIVGFSAVVLSVVASIGTRALSWYALLRGAGIAVRCHHTVSPLLAGFAVSYLTPSMYLGGEPVRAYWVSRDRGIPMARVMATVVVERILSGFSVLAFASIGAVFAVTSPQLSLADKGAVGIALGVLTLLLVLLLIPFARNARWLSGLLAWAARFLPGRKRLLRATAHVAEMEEEIYRAFSHYLGYTLLAFALQLLTVFLNYIRPQIFFHFTQRALFTFPQLSLYFTLSIFVDALLWVTPGGFGLTDGGRVMVFTLLGIPASGGVAFTVVYRFVDLALVGLGAQLLLRRGLISLRRGRFKVEVDRASPAEDQGPSSNLPEK
ncbi:MAG TPA: flippase-like domain-containing protein [Candidatus Acetothermia bacterium]|nr:flippase-like domain-containing protein [Candidatus Acetothermia bacterium]